MARPRLFLIDSFGFIFRAYHARARGAAPPMRTAAGLSTEAVYIFHNMLRKLAKTHKPKWMVAVFESEGQTLREQEYAAYKANRTEMPADLAEQIPWVRRLLDALRVPVLEFPGYEADDVIGTIAKRVAEHDADVVIVSSDKDMLQLVDGRVSMLNPAKDDTWYNPDKVREFLGVAPHQVADLLALKGDSVDNIPGAPGIGDKGARDLIAQFGSVEAAIEGAASVARKAYRESLQNHRDQILLSKKLATIEQDVPVEISLNAFETREPDEAALKVIYRELEFFSLLRELGPSEDTRPKVYRRLTDAAPLLDTIPAGGPVAVAVKPARPDSLETVEIGLCAQAGDAAVLAAPFPASLHAWLQDPARPKVTCDWKSASQALSDAAVTGQGFTHDLLLYQFLLDADPATASLDQLVQRRLDLKLGASPAQQADCILELFPILSGEIDARGLRELYTTIDRPLIDVLARMERTGVRIDTGMLAAISAQMDEEIGRLTSGIHEMAGRPFNINSPQQLSKVLFEELALSAPFRSGRKAASTAADVLEDLAPEHPIVAMVLEYRQVSKLKGTYVDALPGLVRPGTGRLHTTFNPAGAATGRLSSSNPNLQNIPIRTEAGRAIRAAFVPEPGWKLLVADYSQIELRLLAHFSGDARLIEAFRSGEDIHTRTAAEVFGAAPELVTADMRRGAKAVNFGIVYGISGFGLANQLGIPRAEAERYIRQYFERYSGVRRFIDETLETVRRTGVARTLCGRERPIPDMNSRNPNARGFAERTAVNSPLQGTAADLIKLAMIRIDSKLSGLRARMLLQVHDELVFEAPPEEIADLSALVRHQMENVYPLDVPLVVDLGSGDNWRDAK